MAFIITVPDIPAQFAVDEDETIVEAAIAQNIPFPFSCHSGTCGTCKSRLISGSVDLLEYSRFTLTDNERANGLILACRAIPKSNCELSLARQSPIPARRFAGKVASVRDATHDIKIVQIELAARGALQFHAGQYADLHFAGLPARSYSMASKPSDALLDFHIRLSPNGAVSSYVHRTLAVGEDVELDAPIGGSYLRGDHTGPILAVAGGSGLGPIKSIIDTVLTGTNLRPIQFFFGVRDLKDLYYADYFQSLAKKGALRFTPVLSDPTTLTPYRTGYLSDVLSADIHDLSGFEAYLAGPPVMVETCLSVMTSRGLSAADCYADAF